MSCLVVTAVIVLSERSGQVIARIVKGRGDAVL